MEVVNYPPYLPPKTEVKVSIVIHQGTIRIPFKATFTSGNSTWQKDGQYVGVDGTNIKMEQTETSLLAGDRKVSRM